MDQPVETQWDDTWPVSFDGGRVRAWLGVQNPEGSCSRAVQTDGVGGELVFFFSPFFDNLLFFSNGLDLFFFQVNDQQCVDEAHSPHCGTTASRGPESPCDTVKNHNPWNLQASRFFI